jgi:hypothetical protein
VLALLSHLLPLETCKGEPVAAIKKHRHRYFRKTEVLTGYKDRQYTLKRFCRLSPFAQPEPDDYCRGCKKFRHQIELSTNQLLNVKVYKLTRRGYYSVLNKYGQECLVCPVCNLPILPSQTIVKEKKPYAQRYHKECLVIPTLTVEQSKAN